MLGAPTACRVGRPWQSARRARHARGLLYDSLVSVESRTRLSIIAAAALLGAALAAPAHADNGDRGVDSRPGADIPTESEAKLAQQAVDAARETLQGFLADPAQAWLRRHLADARALLVIPKMVRAGLGFFGGSGGHGVLVVRTPDGGWSMPAFYRLGGASVGLEVGVQRIEALLLATTDSGVEALMRGKLQLGVGASVAAGPLGQGVQAATADVLVFERALGLYGGLALEGAGIVADETRNRAYYGRDAGIDDILRRRSVVNDGARALLELLASTSGG